MRITRAALAIALVSGVLVAFAGGPAPRAQSLRRVAMVTAGENPRTAPFYVAFEHRLRQLGWVDGQTLRVEFLHPDRDTGLSAVARSAVARHPDVIVVPGPAEPMQAVRQLTAMVPIVMVAINYDPVAKGYVGSLARPGGNVTGVLYRQLEVDAKQLELLAETLPKGAPVAVLWDPTSADQLRAVESTARTLGIPIDTIEVPPPSDFEAAFRTVQRGHARGVLVLGSAPVFRERARIARLALGARLPAASTAAVAQDADFLLGFGPDLNALFARAADYVDRILRGAAPADLPVEQPTKFQLIVNARTAKRLGLVIPQSLLLRADRVIE